MLGTQQISSGNNHALRDHLVASTRHRFRTEIGSTASGRLTHRARLTGASLSLNMVTEAHAGFRAFNEGPKDDREANFVLLRQRLAQGEAWSGELIDAIQPRRREGR